MMLETPNHTCIRKQLARGLAIWSRGEEGGGGNEI